MPGPLRVTDVITISEGELRWRFSRSSGPGGQSVNTADSRVELSVDLETTPAFSDQQRARVLQRLGDRLVDGVITVTASEQRSQLQNREIAMQRLADLLADALKPPPPPRRPTKVKRSAIEQRLSDKRKRSEKKRMRRVEED